MGLAQAYYTSCDVGLSDFAGFQFNAATPGLSPRVLSEVEALTSYEPPRSLGYRPDPAEIAACPVNLVYHCAPTTVLANVVYVGLDSSRRLGNYFAHALISDAGPGGFGATLPIELWGSPVWVGEPIEDGELPELDAVPAVPTMTPETIEEFLAGQRRAAQLAVLVTAAEDAVLRQGRPIVVIEPDTARTAGWIGAVSYLLPVAVTRRMSFATYRHRPEYSDAHIIGTLPDADFDLGDGLPGYVVFEPESGRISDLDAHPAAALLVRAGTVQAGRLWARARDLVPGPAPASLAEGYPALVIAALLTGTPVTGGDLDALGAWVVTHPADVDPGRRHDLAAVWLEHPARGPQHLRALAALVDETGGGLLSRIEQAAVVAELAGLGAIDTGVRPTTPTGRAVAGDHAVALAPTLSAEDAAALLTWSTDRGVELPDDVRRHLSVQAETLAAEAAPPAEANTPAKTRSTSWWRRCLR